MQVSVEVTEGLGRRMTVTVPEEEIEERMLGQLQKLARTEIIKGFRPGRAPVRIVRQKFGKKVRQQVVNEFLEESFPAAIEQEKLQPATTPEIGKPEWEKVGKGLTYTATFETFPYVESVKADGIPIQRLIAQVTEADIDNMVEILRVQQQTWKKAERPARNGDQLAIDYVGAIEGKEFPEGSATGATLVLGSKTVLDGFEQGLLGTCPGEKVELDLHYPEVHQNPDLADKQVHFLITVNAVDEPVLPELDEAFFQAFEMTGGGLDAFRASVRKDMEDSVEEAIKIKQKQTILKALLAANEEVEVPKVSVEAETKRMYEAGVKKLLDQGMKKEKIVLEPKQYESKARKQVKLLYLLQQIAQKEGIGVDEHEVRAKVESHASTFDDPNTVIKWFYEDEERTQEIEGNVLEEKVVEWILERADFTEKTVDFATAVAPDKPTSR
ncbi:MAG: trigger factor [Gammaproteobacteria bacterium]|nr:trigger factor [Gammaproteobacteria bacterium]